MKDTNIAILVIASLVAVACMPVVSFLFNIFGDILFDWSWGIGNEALVWGITLVPINLIVIGFTFDIITLIRMLKQK